MTFSNYVEVGDHFGYCNFYSAVRFLSEDLKVMHSSIRHLWSKTMLRSLFESAYKWRVSFLGFRYISLVFLLINNSINRLCLYQFLGTKTTESNKSLKTDANGAYW